MDEAHFKIGDLDELLSRHDYKDNHDAARTD